MSDTISQPLGSLFSEYGSYVVGSIELLTALILLAPALLWLVKRSEVQGIRPRVHALGGLMASAVMAGAVFFQLFTPLGIEVLHDRKSDGGSLFYAAVSILILGVVLFLTNMSAIRHRDW